MAHRLEDLQPEWVRIGKEWCAGVDFTCWVCNGRHRVLFINGGGGMLTDTKSADRYERNGTSFSTLSLKRSVWLRCFHARLTAGVFHERMMLEVDV